MRDVTIITFSSIFQTITDILDDQANVIVMKAIQDGIDRVNRESVSNAQTVQKWVILPKDLSVPGGELGPTFKTKRHFVLQKYAQMVDDLYK
jgi:long-chain-fatty-acid--CoA ligase ACSBG